MLGDACLQGNTEHTHTQGWGELRAIPSHVNTAGRPD